MPIFQKSVLKKHLNNLDTEKVEKAYLKFRENYNPSKIKQIKTLKEEEYQDGFLREIFVDVLGYTLRPDENYNLQREFKNQTDGKKADGAILKDGNAIVVIELKSTKTKDLSKITQQAFNYKNNQPECKYVITSNFQKLRFYVDYSTEYEEFDLFHLEKEQFEVLYLILNKESIYSNLPLKIKEETRFHEQQISNTLYKEYSHFKNRLFDSLVKNNTDKDKLTLFKKSQKLLDRFLFILFAEDSGLLPPNSISRIVKRFEVLKEEDAYKPVYDIFKQYFGYMNIGRKGKTASDDIPAYNGGLFYADELIDNLVIDDSVLIDELLNLSKYDFNTEVDVNILGQIFEHSLNEIEEITAEIEGGINDKTKSKRKKDGVFYTPKYITQYIVEKTVGTLCNKKRKELNLEEIEFDGTYRTKTGKLSEKGKKLFNQLKDYKDWLLTLKIIDPACGSGAFLNQALNFLIEEHKIIDDIIAELTNSPMRLFDVDKSILENNLFGVDINEESVEIAKLSLWLRTAQKGRKLSSLNNNIVCENSLLANYTELFPKIMENGGFDCVIGNPPYIKEYTNKQAFDGLHEHYCYQGKMDLWYFFGALALEITKKDYGLIGYIAPNNWITNSGASKFRNIVINKGKLIEFIDFGDFKVFDSAGIQTMIYIMESTDNNENYDFDFSKVLDKRIKHENAQLFLERVKDERFEYYQTSIVKENYLDKPINFINAELSVIIDNIKSKQNFTLNKNEVAQGIVGAPDKAFLVNNDEFLLFNDIEKEFIKEFHTSSSKYFTPISEKKIFYLCAKNFKEDIEDYPNILKHFEPYKEDLIRAKIQYKTPNKKYFFLHRERDEYFFKKGAKIISPTRTKQPSCTYRENEFYGSRALNFIKTDRINLKYLTGLFNSKLSNFWLKLKGKMTGDLLQVDKSQLLSIPIIKPSEEIQTKVSEMVSSIIRNKQKQIDFSSLLEKAKAENNFEREIQLEKELEQINTEIITTENNINATIYELYELEPKIIATIENNINL